ncbi:hypothetical protein BC832DRAFT_590168 [Gaertneriomyces semiglobifer]|nr:hypothetical protein BC832DRAFT_590168 [Gaertneriomyces semiglobifer]
MDTDVTDTENEADPALSDIADDEVAEGVSDGESAEAESNPWSFICPAPRKTSGATILPSSLIAASCTFVPGDKDGKVFVFGGFHNFTDDVYNDLYMLSLGTNAWRRLDHIKGHWPAPRHSHSATLWKNDKLIIFGGRDANDQCLDDMWILDLSRMAWEKPALSSGDKSYLPGRRVKHSACISEDQRYLYLTGGQADDDGPVLSSLHSLDLHTMTWLPPCRFTARHSHFSCTYENKLFVYGGMGANLIRTSAIECINLQSQTVTCTEVTSSAAPPMLGQQFVQQFGYMLIVIVTSCFKPASTSDTDSGMWTLDLRTNDWTHLTPSYRPSPLAWHFHASPPSTHDSILLLGCDTDDETNTTESWLIPLSSLGLVLMPPSSFVPDYRALLNETALSDFVVESKHGGEIKVHSVVLWARSEFFRAVLRGHMRESYESRISFSEPIETLRILVHYLYTDTLPCPIDSPELSARYLACLLPLATSLLLPHLCALVSRSLHRLLAYHPVTSCIPIYMASKKVNDNGLERRALSVMFEDFGKVIRTEEWRSLPELEKDGIWASVPADARLVF